MCFCYLVLINFSFPYMSRSFYVESEVLYLFALWLCFLSLVTWSNLQAWCLDLQFSPWECIELRIFHRVILYFYQQFISSCRGSVWFLLVLGVMQPWKDKNTSLSKFSVSHLVEHGKFFELTLRIMFSILFLFWAFYLLKLLKFNFLLSESNQCIF